MSFDCHYYASFGMSWQSPLRLNAGWKCQLWCVNRAVFYICILHEGPGGARLKKSCPPPHNSWLRLTQESSAIVCKGHCSNAAQEHDLNLIIKVPQREAVRDGVDGPSAKSVLLVYKEEGWRGEKKQLLGCAMRGRDWLLAPSVAVLCACCFICSL